jgi:hypothetical protein
MSEEETEDLSQKYDTKPTIETVLERIVTLEQGLNARITTLEQGINTRIDKMEERIGIRLDRIESEVKITHSELYSMRADCRRITLGV